MRFSSEAGQVEELVEEILELLIPRSQTASSSTCSRAELDAGNDVVHVAVYPEMKKVTPNAAKGSIPYESFFDLNRGQFRSEVRS